MARMRKYLPLYLVVMLAFSSLLMVKPIDATFAPLSTDSAPNDGPAPRYPESNFDLTITLVLIAVVILVVIVVSLILFRRHRKNGIRRSSDFSETNNRSKLY